MTKSNESAYAISKHVRISPTKINLIVAKIRGKSYKEALQILKYLPQKSGAIVWQTLYSAVSNATNNLELEKDKLFITEAFVNQGKTLKRARPVSKGRIYKIEKKMSHITIRVAEQAN
jgi:large subunit ribosomal protein L22